MPAYNNVAINMHLRVDNKYQKNDADKATASLFMINFYYRCLKKCSLIEIYPKADSTDPPSTL